MANAKISVLATQLQTNAAAVATAAAGTIVTSDIQALASMLTAMAAGRLDLMYECLQLAQGPGGVQPATQLTPG